MINTKTAATCAPPPRLFLRRTWREVTSTLQGYLAHKKTPPPPLDPQRVLGMVLLYGPRRRKFLMSEVTLHTLPY